MKYRLFTFNSSHLAIKAGKELKKNKIPYEIVPTPRSSCTSCSLSIRVDPGHRDMAADILRTKGIAWSISQ